MLYTCSGESAADKEAREKKEAADRTKGFHCLSGWDGSNASMVERVTARLRDPDSFKHIETRITPIDKNGSHAIAMKFSSKNGFGGVNQGVATASVDNKNCSASDVEVADLSAID